MAEILLIKITGQDRPGLSSTLMRILADHGIRILDIAQTVIHESVSLAKVVELPESVESAAVLKDLLFRAHQLGLELKFTPIQEDAYEHWVELQGKQRSIITVLGAELNASALADITGTLAEHQLNIDVITRLSGRRSLMGEATIARPRACVEFSVRGTTQDEDGIRSAFLDLSRKHAVDIAYQHDDIYRRTRRLVAFDMDSTLIQTEVIDELAREAGAGEAVAAITEAAMRGELDFKESFTQRVGLLRGLDAAALQQVAERLPLTHGAQRLMSALNGLGYKTAIISGGFQYFGKHLQQLLGIDYVFANELEIENGKVTGRVTGDVIDAKRKAELLRTIAQNEKIRLEQVIAVGDGANDLPMLSLAGLGIAFNAKPLVKQSADHSISNLGLDGVLYLIGYRDREIDELSRKIKEPLAMDNAQLPSNPTSVTTKASHI